MTDRLKKLVPWMIVKKNISNPSSFSASAPVPTGFKYPTKPSFKSTEALHKAVAKMDLPILVEGARIR